MFSTFLAALFMFFVCFVWFGWVKIGNDSMAPTLFQGNLVLVDRIPEFPEIPDNPEDRPTTYILPENIWRPLLGDAIADNLAAADGSLGIRVPRHAFCQEVIHRLGAPLVSTSANLSGRPSPQNYNEIEEELKRRVDYCVPPLPELLSAETRGSRIVKLLPDGTTAILRP